MGQKDLSEKILEDYNDVFADIINGLIFHGEQRINPDDLQDASVHSQYKADDNKLHEMERDVEKYWETGQIRLAILGLENQTAVDKNMPFRVIGYDGNAYRSQLLEVMTGDRRYTDIAMENGREVQSMCEVAERLERTGFIKGRAEGKAEGRAEGKAEGRTEGQNLLIKAVQLIRDGYTEKELSEQGIDQNTIKLAMTIK